MDYKTLLKLIIPPMVFQVRADLLIRISNWNKHGKNNFKLWWDVFKGKNQLPSVLVKMVDHFLNTDESKLVSKYWWYLSRKNIEQLSQLGFENFKQTVSRNYYTWVGPDSKIMMDELFSSISEFLDRESIVDISTYEIFKKHSNFSQSESIDYNINTILFYRYMLKLSLETDVLIFDEPKFGNSPIINIDNKMVSQDLLNSCLDYINISSCFDFSKASCIIELGAGYGRTAYYILKMQEKLSYIIVDIPPALFLSQEYLKNVLPEKKCLEFRENLRHEDLFEAINNNALIFLTPDQIKIIGNKAVDLFIAIDNLHAMTIDQVNQYFEEVNRTSKAFYFTYWPKMKMPFDNFTHNPSRWPIKQSWKMIKESKTRVPSCYMNVFYKTE